MDVNQIIGKIRTREFGAKLFKVDLHIHTPASKDFKDSVKPEDIVEKAIKTELNIIAVTDHNSVEWCEKVINAAKDKPLDVFPGVEISTHGGKIGLHFLAIFDKGKPIREIKDCLARIGLDSKKQGDADALTNESIEKIMKEVRTCGGIVIGAHAYSEKGICAGMKGAQRTSVIQDNNLCAIEINDISNIDYFKGNDPNYKRILACIKSSDAHSLDEIGKEFTLIKMGEANLEGLRQAFCDPQSRIRFDPKQVHNHPSIIGMYIEGGFLDGEVFHFNENMNNLIGGKGTGKTTAIELMRFALYSPHKNEKLKEEYEEMVEYVLGDGTTHLLIKTNDNQLYLISRKLNEEPKIYRENGDLFEINIDNFYEFFDIECYSQGELICIARDSTNQLKMIDKYIDFENLFDEERIFLGKLSNNATLILQNNEKVDELKAKTERLPTILEKIRIIEEKGLKQYSETQKKWEYEKVLLKNMLEKLNNKIQEIGNSLIFDIDEVEFEKNMLVNEKDILNFKEEFTSIGTTLQAKHKDIADVLKGKLELLSKKREKWEIGYTKQLEEFKKITDELKSQEIDVDNYLKLEEEKNTLVSNKEEIVRKEKENQDLLKERNDYLKKLATVRKNISEKRKSEIDKVNEKLKDVLHINLKRESYINQYVEWMIDCLKGSRAQKEDIRSLCGLVPPTELYNIIQNKKEDSIDILSSKTGINKSFFERIINYQPFISKLFELQSVKLEDELDIKLNDQGWKSLPHLSTGGKCTAILLIAMLERRTPLLIDQPEDSLDNSFVYKSVVQILRKLKDKRQMIIVTHNANIPVLGDCEQMLIMNSNGLKGDIRHRGVIDDKEIKGIVQTILEGGEEAFKKRREKYGI